jgi:hypothetical protein
LKTLEYPNTYTYSATFLTTVGVNLEEKLLFLQLTKKILNFCHERFTDDHVEILKKKFTIFRTN